MQIMFDSIKWHHTLGKEKKSNENATHTRRQHWKMEENSGRVGEMEAPSEAIYDT